MSRRHRNAHPCPTALKVGYGTRDEAEAALAEVQRLAERGRTATHSGEKVPVRAYWCACARWHLTSRR